jgi:hypothetical protein
MISKLATVYAGHVDLPDRGQFQWFSKELMPEFNGDAPTS